MIVRLDKRQKVSRLRAGDVIYDINHTWPLYFNITDSKVDCPHAGIVLDSAVDFDGGTRILVIGLPADRNGSRLGTAYWPDCGWEPQVVGQRMDVPEENIAEVTLVWNDIRKETSRLGHDLWFSRSITWTEDPPYKKISSLGSPFFESGTCVGFVEYCYEQAGLDLVADDGLDLSTLPTTVQMHAFWREQYPLRIDLHDRKLLQYPQCVE